MADPAPSLSPPSKHGRQTELRLGWLVAGIPFAFAAANCMVVGLGKVAKGAPYTVGNAFLLGGAALWLGGWVLIAAGIRHRPAVAGPRGEAVGAPLYPRLAKYRDFYWSTLAAYGGGFVLAEAALILSHVLLAGGDKSGPVLQRLADLGRAAMDFLVQTRAGPTAAVGLGISAPIAFAIAGSIGCAVAFAGGFLGAARARRLSVPEATLGFLYFGTLIPLGLTLLAQRPDIQIRFPMLREVFYLASLLGRPELGFWLVYAGLGLSMILGMTFGFVATGSGRFDLRAGVEVFIAGRHVAVFHPKIIAVVGLILLFGIVGPLLILLMVMAADAAAQRLRIRRLGEEDPLAATAAADELARKAYSPTEFMTAISVFGVGVGVQALIVVLSVMSGFELDLQQKILGTNAHAVVLKYSGAFDNYAAAMKKIATVPGVIGQTPFIMQEVMISSDGNISGTVIKGIDPATVVEVSDLKKNILEGGSLEYLSHPEEILQKRLSPQGGPVFDRKPVETQEEDPIIGKVQAPTKEAALPGIIVGRELAAGLRVVVGDRVNVVSPLGGELGPQGPMPKMRPFRVAGIFYSGMYEYDSKFVYIHLDEARRFFNLDGVTGIELKVNDIDDARKISKQVYEKLEGYPFHTKDWGEMNKNLFAALRLEKLVMGLILSIIIVVAAGLIVATVIMLVLEKRKEISVLKALGVPDGGIVKIFLAEGLQIGIAGGVLGLLSGLAVCLAVEKFGIKLDPEVYYIPALPVRIEPFQTGLAVVMAILITYLGSIYPALKASQVEPVEGLKGE